MDFSINIPFPDFEPGSIWLAGAGPGDAKLLTLYALYGLQKADVIVHDALVSSDILAMAHAGAELISMGKRGGQASPKQGEITQELITLAKSGKSVLRLKGGDPFVFGRGAEEALPLLQEKITVRIIPGITAGIAGSAYGGVPVSDGQTNQVISFVTGHDKTGNVPAVNWSALAQSSPVIVFYMPMKHVAKIQHELLVAGRGVDEPVCFVMHATTPEQQELQSTLGNCLIDLEKSNIKSPAILIVGPTVQLRAALKGCF